MEKVVKVLLYLWQLPQNLLGLLLLCFYKCDLHFRVKSLSPNIEDLAFKLNGIKFVKPKKSKYCNPVVHICPNFRSGISLGDIIIIKTYKFAVLRHEWGHSIDSVRFGPLYLLVIGIPSLLNNIFGISKSYYDFWTERRADKNGGIIR